MSGDVKGLLGCTLVLVAHPDDEAVGCGVLLQRMRDPVVVFATDGAPHDKFFWEAHGSRTAYRETRRREARDALGIIGVKQVEFLAVPNTGEPFTDQELYLCIPDALRALDTLLDRYRPEAMLTLAYEGGHPDHDTCNLLAWRAAQPRNLPVFEMPLYHRLSDGRGVWQQFLSPNENEIVVEPAAHELDRKQRMLATYVSQGEVLKSFASNLERFRPLVPYDYSRPPHPGTLNYEAWQWRMTGTDVARAFASQLPARSVPQHHFSDEDAT